MGTDFNKVAKDIFNFVGSEENIILVGNCMTRLRLKLKDRKKVNISDFRRVEGVLGVVETQEQLQIIIEPQKAKSLISEFIKVSKAK